MTSYILCKKQPNFDVALGYNLLIIGARDAGVREVVSAYISEPTSPSFSTQFLRANQKPVRLSDNRILILDIIQRPGEIFRECYGDLVRSNGVLLVYNPVSATSFQHVTGFYEQIIRSKWRSLPVVLFSNTPPHLGVTGAREFHGRDFAKAHAIPFIEASSGGPLSTPFLTLLNLARQRYETSSSTSCGDGFTDFVTVAAAKVSRAMRSHRVASPPIPSRRELSGNLPAPRHASCLPNASRFLTFRRSKPTPKSRR
ncbi:hypothetical protein BGW80DRAFT_1255224 [Lactifluus volemus]|nr:hypothetical protein BGW80DRAFT_1255224 [Lactifluus volemus]